MGSSERIRHIQEERKQVILGELRKSTVLNEVDRASNSLDHSVKAMEKLSVYLSELDYGEQNQCSECGRKGLTAEQGGKTLAYIAKMVNEITRLLQFAKGEPDSRTEIKGLDTLLAYLSRDQFDQLTTWIEEGQHGEAQC